MSTAASHPRLPVPFATQAAIRSVLRNEGDRAAELGREQRCSLTPLLCLRRGHKGRAQRSKGAPEPQGTDQGEIAPRPQSAVRITPPRCGMPGSAAAQPPPVTARVRAPSLRLLRRRRRWRRLPAAGWSATGRPVGPRPAGGSSTVALRARTNAGARAVAHARFVGPGPPGPRLPRRGRDGRRR